jgi:hypothetical protein
MDHDHKSKIIEQESELTDMSSSSISRRTLRKRSSSTVIPPDPKKTPSDRFISTHTKVDKDDDEDNGDDNPMEKARHLITSWICAECKEAECITHPDSPLLICEGPCLRLFHYPCARLPALPLSDQPWICEDCTQKRHKCTLCHEYGIDDLEVYKCEKKTCGLFYHEQCLSIYDQVTVTRVDRIHERWNEEKMTMDRDEQNSVEGEDVPVLGGSLKFKCPAHFCWTCSGGVPLDDDGVQEKSINIMENHDNSIRDVKAKKRSQSKSNSLYACFQDKSGDLIVRFFFIFSLFS